MRFNAEKVNWEKVKKPNDLLKIFQPDPKDPIEFEKKIVRFKNNLRDKYLYLSDQYRHPRTIDVLVNNYFYGGVFNIFYEMGEFQGLIGITNILPEFKASVIFKIWDSKAWTPKNAKKIRELGDIIMGEFMLKRLTIQTPDRRMIKFGKIIGFELEGEKPFDFKWNGRLYTTYMLGMCKGIKKVEKVHETEATAVKQGVSEEADTKEIVEKPVKKTAEKKATEKKATKKKATKKKATKKTTSKETEKEN